MKCSLLSIWIVTRLKLRVTSAECDAGAAVQFSIVAASRHRISAQMRSMSLRRVWSSDGLGTAARGRDEDVFDRQVEQLGDAEGERQRRVVLAGLDRVDALSRDFQAAGEVGLAQAAFGAQDLEEILHLSS